MAERGRQRWSSVSTEERAERMRELARRRWDRQHNDADQRLDDQRLEHVERDERDERDEHHVGEMVSTSALPAPTDRVTS